jgi:hypothetical protein
MRSEFAPVALELGVTLEVPRSAGGLVGAVFGAQGVAAGLAVIRRGGVLGVAV